MRNYSTTRHLRHNFPYHIAGDPLRIGPTMGPARARYIRKRAADLRLAAGALDRDPPPPFDRELSLALDRWLEAREAWA